MELNNNSPETARYLDVIARPRYASSLQWQRQWNSLRTETIMKGELGGGGAGMEGVVGVGRDSAALIDS